MFAKNVVEPFSVKSRMQIRLLTNRTGELKALMSAEESVLCIVIAKAIINLQFRKNFLLTLKSFKYGICGANCKCSKFYFR